MKTAAPASGIEARVCDDIAARQQKGVSKYGHTVESNPLSIEQWLQHAYEECLDQAVYLKKSIAVIGELSDARKDLEQERDTLQRSNAELKSQLMHKDETATTFMNQVKRLHKEQAELSAQVARLRAALRQCEQELECCGHAVGSSFIVEHIRQPLSLTPSDALKEYMKPWVECIENLIAVLEGNHQSNCSIQDPQEPHCDCGFEQGFNHSLTHARQLLASITPPG